MLDPETKEGTHIVVRKGFLFTEDKVIPMALISAATEEGVTLRENVGDLQTLPLFEGGPLCLGERRLAHQGGRRGRR